jgi:membrane protein YdbS with pleckstrin-like domain
MDRVEDGAARDAPRAAGEAGVSDAAPATGARLELRPPRNAVDPRAVRWWTAQALLNVVPLALGLAVATALLDGARPWLLAALAIVVVGGGAYVVVMPRWRYRVHRWETTDEAVYAAAGWIWQEWRVAPLSRVQTVDTVRGPLQQLFGLATVTVTTASAKGEIKIDGLDHALAVDVVDRLTATTQAIPGDAT